MFKDFKKRVISTGLAVAMLLFVSAGMFTNPRVARAQGDAPPIIAQMQAEFIENKFWQKTREAVEASVGTMLIDLMVFTANELAYSAAMYAATGGPGESALFVSDRASDYLGYVGTAIIMSTMDGLEEQWGGINFGPGNPYYLENLRIQVSRGYLGTTTSDFNFGEIKENWEGYRASIEATIKDPKAKTQAILTGLSSSFDTNEFVIGSQLTLDILGQALTTSEYETLEVIANSHYAHGSDAATGDVETPASFIEGQVQDAYGRIGDLPNNIGNSALASSNNLLAKVGASMVTVFTNTLASELLKKAYSGMFDDIAPYVSPYDPDALATNTRERAASILSSLKAYRPLQVTDYSLITELSSCSAGSYNSIRQVFSCAMDTSFAAAVTRASAGSPLTVQEAIDEGYLNGNWAMIPSSDTSRNQSTRCYTYGFCYGNLVKLRKARIIPIGWELVANSEFNNASDPVTLQEAIDGFYDCNSLGEADNDHPWCHMIDPNWVLKSPQSQCNTYAYGQQLEIQGGSTRSETCVDVQTCVSENDDGSCEGGYGYCVREKNVWQFSGDSCPEQYASCLSFRDSDGEEVNYLTSTVDRAGCSESTEGCLWYSTTQQITEEETFDWPVINDLEVAEEQEDIYKDRMYLTGSVEDCASSSAGCSEVLEREPDATLNMIYNSSFETDNDENGRPDGWFTSNWSGVTYDITSGIARIGSAVIAPTSANVYQYGPVIGQSRFYSFTFYAAQASSVATDTITVSLSLSDEFDEEAVDLTGTSYAGDCSIADLDGDGFFESVEIDAVPTSDSYERFECIFTAPALTNRAGSFNTYLQINASSVLIDDLQLEQTEDPNSYHLEYATDLNAEYVKLPPDYLGCTGAEDDPAECDGYASICSANEDGCLLYTPANGDPEISAIVSDLDYCPSECNGYDTYKQEGTRYEPNGEFPLYFIPDSADECRESAVGCDEFTNLTTEEREYYTYLRACVDYDQAGANTNGDQDAVFYTWEGSDKEGYQLKTWYLLESDLDSSAYSGYSYGPSFVESDPGAAPCTNWTMDADGITCNDDADGDLAIDSYSALCNEHDDIFDNPTCREFYDASGGIHYRDWQDTVTVNDACSTYRKTDIAGLGDDNNADGVDDGQENCEDAGGYFDSAINACKFFGLSSESVECRESENGCRQYTGGRSANSRVAFTELFEDGTLANWGAATATGITLSNESIATSGHSIESAGVTVWTHFYDNGGECTTTGGCASGTGALGGECTVIEGDTYCGTLHNELYTGKTYTLSFWAKGSGTIDVGFDIEASGSGAVEVPFEEDIELSSEWQKFSVGPLNMTEDEYEDFGNGSILVFEPDTGGTFYIDNVTLREGEDNITLIKDTWVTPSTCDENFNGQVSPQYYLGCSAYSSSGGGTVYLKSFSRLCSEDKVGCAGYYATQQSDSVYGEVLNATCYNVVQDATGVPTEVAGATTCYLEGSSGTSGSFDTDSQDLCTIPTGENSCLFDLDFYIPEGSLATDPLLAHIAYEAETVYTPGDIDIYAIVESDDTCSSRSAGCSAFGAPTISADKSLVESWDTVYFIDDPASYDDILCSATSLFCDAYDAGSEGVYYFKDPQKSVCEYKTDVYIGGTKYDGWFREDTSDFCYGTGSCSDSGVACSLDSDCREDSGTCSVSGAVCTNDSDCGAAEFCEGTSTETCDIESGSYLIGGEYSGMWLTGDEDYADWVGACDEENNGCTELRDPLDVDDDEFYASDPGESYFFVRNASLSGGNLLSSDECDGQVSLEQGCVLFDDIGDTDASYNASATYISSVHADELYGDRPFALVDPIDCDSGDATITTPSGEEVNLCAQRCVYKSAQLDTTASYSIYDYTYGSSCYEDADCTNYESNQGDIVSGSCESTVRTGIFSGLESVPALENDTNTVLRVDRSRVCSEWLTCSSYRTIWDSETAQYQTVCDSIDLCSEYSESGDASFCSAWDPDDPLVVLDTERYVDRDISWYGEEYSGFAIPDLFPVQYFSQINTAAPGSCYNETTGKYTGDSCSADTDCADASAGPVNITCDTGNAPEAEYRLGVIAYSLDEGNICEEDDYETECTVGYCSDTGATCGSSSDCAAGDCVTGVCYTVSTTSCTTDTDCTGTGQECLDGVCVAEGGNCDINFTCGTGETCYVSDSANTGTCYYGDCALTIEGNTFEDELAEELICRAYPEKTSPFGNQVVEEWKYQDDDGASFATTSDPEEQGLGLDETVPISMISSYENVNLCGPGEVCECNYTTLTTGIGDALYLELNTTLADLAAEYGIDNESDIGICSGGFFDGALCDVSLENDETNDACGADGTCYRIQQKDQLVGLEGYCLEQDTSVDLYGRQNNGACVTWLPVDELKGSTDLYAKYTEAGYFDDTYMCTEVGAYADLLTSNPAPSIAGAGKGIACAEYPGNPGNCLDSSTYADMISAAVYTGCPENYFAIVGPCGTTAKASSGHYSGQCRQTTGDDDFPYLCVPKNSVHSNGELCEPPEVDGDTIRMYTNPWTNTSLGATYDIDYYFFDPRGSTGGSSSSATALSSIHYDEVDNLIDEYLDCRLQGFEWNGQEFQDALDISISTKSSGSGYYNLYIGYDYYPACSVVTKVSSLEDGSYAWTDRIMNDSSDFSNIIDTSYPDIEYSRDITPGIFGASKYNASSMAASDNVSPIKLPACDDVNGYINPVADDDFVACDSLGLSVYDGAGDALVDTNPADPGARAYIEYDFNWSSGMTFNPSTATYDSVIGRINQVFASIGFARAFTWDGDMESGLGYEDGGEGSADDLYSSYDDVRGTEGSAPRVWSIDTTNCYGAYCREGSLGQITLNDRDTGDQTGDGGFFRANVKFFAAADKNQLPLRRVIVDWGDGDESGSDSENNYYKNHRGLLPDSQTQTYCDTNDEWGMTSDSCDPNYFNYTHNYRCSAKIIADLPSCASVTVNGNITEACTDQTYCYYQPRVHVRDNWGWCSGTCDGDECFDSEGDISYPDPDSECNYDKYPTATQSNTDPWVYYGGVIQVEP